MKKILIITSCAVILGTLMFAVPSVLAQTNGPVGPRHLERHPAIRRAIFALQAAKTDMQHADHDFGGHRAAALDECDKAIAQLQLALQYDQQ